MATESTLSLLGLHPDPNSKLIGALEKAQSLLGAAAMGGTGLLAAGAFLYGEIGSLGNSLGQIGGVGVGDWLQGVFNPIQYVVNIARAFSGGKKAHGTDLKKEAKKLRSWFASGNPTLIRAALSRVMQAMQIDCRRNKHPGSCQQVQQVLLAEALRWARAAKAVAPPPRARGPFDAPSSTRGSSAPIPTGSGGSMSAPFDASFDLSGFGGGAFNFGGDPNAGDFGGMGSLSGDAIGGADQAGVFSTTNILALLGMGLDAYALYKGDGAPQPTSTPGLPSGLPSGLPGMSGLPAMGLDTGLYTTTNPATGLPMTGAAGPNQVAALCTQLAAMRAAKHTLTAQMSALSAVTRKAKMLARLMGLPVPADCKVGHARRKQKVSCAPRRRRAPKRRAVAHRKARRHCGGRTAAQRRFAAAARRFGGRIPRGTHL